MRTKSLLPFMLAFSVILLLGCTKPATTRPSPKAVINIAAIPGVTVPDYGATPVRTITETAQYAGTVSWSPEVPSTFWTGTCYTATITLSVKAGYTLTGVAADFFTVAGATSATNLINSGVVMAVFPATTANLAKVTDYTGTGVGTLKGVTGGTFNNGTAHITVSSFRMSQHEVTGEQYAAVMGVADPSYFSSVLNNPVEQVTWYDAVRFCNKLSKKEGLDRVYTIIGSESPLDAMHGPTVIADFSANGYRLPTEAEWEFAARGGNSSNNYTYAGSNTIGAVSWYSGNSSKTSHTVGGLAANELGIYDLSGNVWEWCGDRFSTIPITVRIQGGSWSDDASDCIAPYRNGWEPYYCNPIMRSDHVGFRVVRP